MFEISVRRVHEPRGKLNVGDKQETVDLIEGDVECRSYDSITVPSTWELTSVYMRYSQGDGVHTPLSRLVLYPRVICKSLCVCVLLCYIALPAARSCTDWDDNNKDKCVYTNYTCTAKTPAPIQDHLIDHLV